MTNGKRPTEILKEEHEKVLQKLDEMEESLAQLDNKEMVSAKLKELAAFFKTDFWVHFSKEEDALFPELEKFLPRQMGPIGVMLMEHEDLRSTNKTLQQAVDTYFNDSDNPKTKELLQDSGTHFIGVLRDHIDKENNILFQMADMHLNQAQLDKIIKLFAEIEKK